MVRYAALLLAAILLALAPETLAQAKLPKDRQAALDGSYAAISQKSLNAMQMAIAQGKLDPSKVAQDMEFNRNSIQQARARWANTPYAKNFEQGFQAQMEKRPAPPPPQNNGGTDPGKTIVRGPVSYSAPPIELAWWVKAVLFFGGLWACKKLWKAPAAGAKASAVKEIAIEYSSQERQRLAEAQARCNARLAVVQTQDQTLRGRIREQQSQPALKCAAGRGPDSGSNVARADSRAAITTRGLGLESGRPCQRAPSVRCSSSGSGRAGF